MSRLSRAGAHVLRVPSLLLMMNVVALPYLRAQETTGILRGTVVDSTTLDPVPGVAAYLDGRRLVDRTDSTGVFRLNDVATGSHGLLLMRDGYTPQLFHFMLPDTITGQIDLAVIGLVHGPAPTPVVSGTVVDANTDQPLPLAEVKLNGKSARITGADGSFLIDSIPTHWGMNSIEIRRMGYAPMEADLWIAKDDVELDLDIGLNPVALRLSEVVVEGDRTTVAYGRAREFYRRRRMGFGQFITQEEIERWRPTQVTDLFRRIPGAWLFPDGAGGYVVRLSRRGYFSCPPNVYLDGVRISRSLSDDLDMMVWPDQILGIEVYSGPAQIPPQFNPTGAVCGAVVIWTQ